MKRNNKLGLNWIRKRWLGIITILACTLIILITIASMRWIHPQNAQTILLGLTLFVLILYTYITALLARYSHMTLGPSVSYRIEDILADPVTREVISYISENIEQRILNHTTRFFLENVGDRWANVFVRLNLRVSSQQVDFPPFYTGDSYWTLLPKQGKWGHFEIRKILELAGISPDEALLAYEEDRKGFVTMNLELEYYGSSGVRIENPPQQHFFNFDTMCWQIIDVGPIPEDR
jgi:hypothetical protein